jgi:hypothetical protein
VARAALVVPEVPVAADVATAIATPSSTRNVD